MHKEYGRTLWQHLQVAYVSNSGIFYQHWLLNCIYNARFWVPSQDRKGSAMLYGETSIAAEVVHNLPIMYEEVERRFWTHLQAPYCPHHAISVMIDSHISHKMPHLGYPIVTGNGMLCYNERYTLLLKCFITYLSCIRKVRGACDNIHRPLMGHIVPFLWGRLSKCPQNTRFFWVPYQHGKQDTILQGDTSIATGVFHVLP